MTKENRHTPGPWCYEMQHDIDRDGNGYCWAVNGLTKAQRERSKPGLDYVQNPAYANSEANARLIAAAPELLAALQSLFEHCAMVHKHWGAGCNQKEADAAIASARVAIAKAEGN